MTIQGKKILGGRNDLEPWGGSEWARLSSSKVPDMAGLESDRMYVRNEVRGSLGEQSMWNFDGLVRL